MRFLIRPFKGIIEFFRAFTRRLKLQGPKATAQWLYTVGGAWLTGRISLRFSKVTPNIYLGPQYGRYGKKYLEKSGITASVSLRAEYDDASYDLQMPDYSYLPTIDNTAPTMEQLQEGVNFMRDVIAQEGIVYVHCGSGVGRSPTLVAAYLMAEVDHTVDEAVAQIMDARPFVRILPSQLERLEEYEQHLKMHGEPVTA